MQVKKLIICSWNVQGLGDPATKTLFSLQKMYGVGLLCFQEMHLTNVSIPQLGWGDFRTWYHSVHTSYSRGVSILIRSGVTVNCRQIKIDKLGRYSFFIA